MPNGFASSSSGLVVFSGMNKKDPYLSVSIWLWPLVHSGVTVVHALLGIFFVILSAYNVLLKSKAKQRKRNRSYPECPFWQLSLHYYKNRYFYYVQVMAVSLGKSHEHSIATKFGISSAVWIVWSFSSCGLYSAYFDYDVLQVLKRKLLLRAMCIMTPLLL